ncbi:hypothetical protein NVP1063O_098 [Vibrio phage 1.063.O._10N.261.45.C7]|nr:hypothetical protein NVP1063O_098 [Vibrio phage 1.063.O._10N.261.45.C7]
MSITKFEEGKRYRFLKNGTGVGDVYCGVDTVIGQEFTVHNIDPDGDVFSKDVTFQGMKDSCEGWVLHGNNAELPTTLDDFEEVLETSVVNIEEEENIFPDLIKEVITLQQEHNLVLMFHGGEVVVTFENSDTEYQISSQEELTTLIEASKVMKRFERKVNYHD